MHGEVFVVNFTFLNSIMSLLIDIWIYLCYLYKKNVKIYKKFLILEIIF